MKLRTAAYARYSSDRQSPASIEDQLRKCREHAKANDWLFLEKHVYTDEAMSGGGADRPGFIAMLQAAARTLRPFDVLLLDDTSRLSRSQGETARVFERFNFIGIRIVAVSQGIDSENEQADVLMAVHGLVDSLYIKELGKKTYRGLEGRALKGLHTGGRCFGYDNVADEAGVRQRINGKEAETVRRIFEMAAEGGSLKAIAKALNHDGVAPARPRAGKRYATWCPTAIREMLRRELYIGRIVWNRSHFVKQPARTSGFGENGQPANGRFLSSPNCESSMLHCGSGFKHGLRGLRKDTASGRAPASNIAPAQALICSPVF